MLSRAANAKFTIEIHMHRVEAARSKKGLTLNSVNSEIRKMNEEQSKD